MESQSQPHVDFLEIHESKVEASTQMISPTSIEKDSKLDHRLLSYDEMPEWCRDNKFILHGYRPVSNSVDFCFSSWRYMHNESINIFTHLIPSTIFLLGLGFITNYLDNNYPNVTTEDDLIFAFFILTATACLSLSAFYHTLTNHSPRVDTLWLRLDFAGIVLLTLGDIISGIYMVFWCEPLQRKIYWAMILSLGTITMIVLIVPKSHGRKWRTFRVLCFVGTGLSGFAPLAHGIYMFGRSQMMKQSGMPYYLAEGGLLALGALVYTTRFPECLKPGIFDFYGASHQIFHVLVVSATVVQLVGLLAAYDYNYTHRFCAKH